MSSLSSAAVKLAGIGTESRLEVSKGLNAGSSGQNWQPGVVFYGLSITRVCLSKHDDAQAGQFELQERHRGEPGVIDCAKTAAGCNEHRGLQSGY